MNKPHKYFTHWLDAALPDTFTTRQVENLYIEKRTPRDTQHGEYWVRAAARMHLIAAVQLGKYTRIERGRYKKTRG